MQNCVLAEFHILHRFWPPSWGLLSEWENGWAWVLLTEARCCVHKDIQKKSAGAKKHTWICMQKLGVYACQLIM